MILRKIIWGNSLDGSVCGMILAENDAKELNWYLGSRKKAGTETEDIDYILKYGQKFPVDAI